MKILVDTCGWIEWLIDGKFSHVFGEYLEKSKHLVVPVIVQYELFKWVCRERDESTAYDVISLTQKGEIVAVDTPLALLAAEVSAQHQLAMADAVVYATALQCDAKVITIDKHFASLPNVEYLSRK